MIYLIIVSIIWALSFSLIKGSLTSIDPNFVAFFRLLISLIIFVPFLRYKQIKKNNFFQLLIIGILQYGLMYLAYIYSYQYLKAYEIAILTIFTPIFVVLIYDIWVKEFTLFNWLKAILAILGAGIIVYSENTEIGFWKGIILVQLSNFLFALGQVYYKKLNEGLIGINHKSNYAIIFLGATLVTAIFSYVNTDFQTLEITTSQWLILLYLGVIASGLGFFLWNYGVVKVEVGLVAVLNNLKIPLGVIFAIILVNESVNILQLAVGSLLILLALRIGKISNNKAIN
ncbi:MAG: EamA family transporter [Melioribacteraceae bacterium]|nr:EamA family transporter [Melioribacteraceae bacterium]